MCSSFLRDHVYQLRITLLQDIPEIDSHTFHFVWTIINRDLFSLFIKPKRNPLGTHACTSFHWFVTDITYTKISPKIYKSWHLLFLVLCDSKQGSKHDYLTLHLIHIGKNVTNKSRTAKTYQRFERVPVD